MISIVFSKINHQKSKKHLKKENDSFVFKFVHLRRESMQRSNSKMGTVMSTLKISKQKFRYYIVRLGELYPFDIKQTGKEEQAKEKKVYNSKQKEQTGT